MLNSSFLGGLLGLLALAQDKPLGEDGPDLYADPFPPQPEDGLLVSGATEEPATRRQVSAFLVVGSEGEIQAHERVNDVYGYLAYDDLTPEETAEARDQLLDMVEDLTPAEFVFDCIPTRIADGPTGYDVYVVRGDDEARARFNRRIEQVGGGCAPLSEPAVRALDYAWGVLNTQMTEDAVPEAPTEDPITCLERKMSRGYLKQSELEELVRLKVRAQRENAQLDPFDDRAAAEEDLEELDDLDEQAAYAAFHTEQAEAEKSHRHRSPSDERYRLRHNYGVTRSQLLKIGLHHDAARYISDRVIDELKSGAPIVEAIENAHKLWATAHEEWDWIDRFNRRVAANLTVPRMVRDGWRLDQALSCCHTADLFMEAGMDLGGAFAAAGLHWTAKETSDRELFAQVKQVLTETRYVAFFEELVGNRPGSIVWEQPSGASWVAEVAADLCNETNPKTGRGFTMAEAARQAGTEWQSMTREARVQIRDAYYRGDGKMGYCLEAADDEDSFVRTWAKEWLTRIEGFSEVTAAFVAPMVVRHAQAGKSLLDAVEAATRDWKREARLGLPQEPPEGDGIAEPSRTDSASPAAPGLCVYCDQARELDRKWLGEAPAEEAQPEPTEEDFYQHALRDYGPASARWIARKAFTCGGVGKPLTFEQRFDAAVRYWRGLSIEESLHVIRESEKAPIYPDAPVMSEVLEQEARSRTRPAPQAFMNVTWPTEEATAAWKRDVQALQCHILETFPAGHWTHKRWGWPEGASWLLVSIRRDVPTLPLVAEALFHVLAAAEVGEPPSLEQGATDAYSAWLAKVRTLKTQMGRAAARLLKQEGK